MAQKRCSRANEDHVALKGWWQCASTHTMPDVDGLMVEGNDVDVLMWM